MVYNKRKSNLEWYYKNREREMQHMKKWRQDNKDYVKQYRREHHLKNRDKILAHKKQYRLTERAKELKKKDGAKYYLKNKDKLEFQLKRQVRQRKHYTKNRERILAYGKQHSQLPHVKARTNEMARIRRRANPQSNRSLSYDLQDAMNNVRIRDNNTCQWQGCGVTHRQSRIDVHHIFPRSEYPELELVEQYMICYCANHHGYWHRMRGDPYSEMIHPSHEYMRANPDELLLGGD